VTTTAALDWLIKVFAVAERARLQRTPFSAAPRATTMMATLYVRGSAILRMWR
jgi:hypothetical protein